LRKKAGNNSTKLPFNAKFTKPGSMPSRMDLTSASVMLWQRIANN
jgi:hypothetical protein